MKFRTSKAFIAGFSRTDLTFTLGTLGLIFLCTTASVFSTGDSLLLAPNARERAKRMVCLANLRELGNGFQRWAAEHEDRNPMHVPVAEGGVRGHVLAPNVWFQYAALSNELASARILVCPSDTNIMRVAKDFSANIDGGLMYPAYRNNAVSYFVGLHGFFYEPQSILAGDPNVLLNPQSTGCSYVALSGPVRALDPRSNPPAAWLGNVHGFEGNLLFNDGSAQETTSAQLREILLRPWPDDVSPVAHIFTAR